MTPTSALVAFLLFDVAASLTNDPGCLPDEDAIVVSESMFLVPDPNNFELLTNLTLTHFTCPSRQAQDQAPNETALKRQSQTPVDLCGIMDSSEVSPVSFGGPG